MSLRLWIVALCALWIGGFVPARAQQARTLSSPASPVRVLERSEGGVVLEVDIRWGLPLAEAVRSGADLEAVALRAVKGHGLVTEALDLPTLAPPTVEVLAADYDEIPFTPPSGAAPGYPFVGPAAAVTSIGLDRKRPAGTFVARMLQFDAERGTLRRYRRIVAAVRFAPEAARGAGAARMPNPHLDVTESVLASGTWFKIPVTREGIYRIDRAWLSSVGLTPDSIDPDRVAVYGNGGAPLPALNSASRIPDLAENATLVVGGGDGSFGESDGVYFYGAAPNGWRWNPDADEDEPGWNHFINLFSRENVYFVRVDAPSAQRVGAASFPGLAGATVRTSVTGRTFREEDLPDGMIDRDGGGSGLDWMGAEVLPSRPTTVALDTLPPGLAAGTVQYRARVATRATRADLAFLSGGQTLEMLTARTGGRLAGDEVDVFSEEVGAGERLRLEMRLVGSSGTSPQGWIDYVEAFYPKALQAQDGYLRFATPGGEEGPFEFVLSGFAAEPQVWDVTDPASIRRLGVRADGGTYRVQVEPASADDPREIVAFNPSGSAVRRPAEGVPVENQNLHGVTAAPDYVIVVAEAFREAADELAEYRAADGLRPLVTEVEDIYNEFSGGLVDMRAVRDYLRFLYDRAPDSGPDGGPALRFVLLFGDGHFDFRGIRPNGDQNNWVPVYQSDNSFDRVRSYTSDDYFALLDPGEGVWNYNDESERVDLGVGRLPVRSAEEALTAVAKIKRYENPTTRGAWRTRYTFVADDQFPNASDLDLHLQNADLVSDTVKANFPGMNLQKIYSMTYPRVQTALGARYPEAHNDIIRSFNEGTLVWNYSGHGGSGALADERLLIKEDIMLLDNTERLPIVITATCSFGRYDLVDEQSGAELFLLNTGGGAAAIFTTTRLVYTSNDPGRVNLGLNVTLNRFLLSRGADGRPLRLGDTYRLTKRTNDGAERNNRKFSLLGDPAMRIQLPERDVAVTTINGQPVARPLPKEDGPVRERSSRLASAVRPVADRAERGDQAGARGLGMPELRALEEAEISGEVLGPNGLRDTGYNGEVEVAVFDAKRKILLPEEVVTYTPGFYDVRNDLIYRGRATVRDGAWTARFVVPRDISYSNEPGRVSAYVTDADAADGFGFTEGFVVGGTSANPIQDNEGPRISLFLNDTTFVPGGLVGTTPVFVAKLFDQNGINTVGAGVGHELLLTIDGQEQEALDVGRFYRGDLDSFRRGTVELELPDQTPGPHTLTLRAWDVANNSSSASLDYFVEPDGELVLRNVYNYPNPTTGPTRFVFEHNQPPGSVARVQLRIYTLSGRPIRTLDAAETLPAGALTGSLVQIPWDGRDEDFDLLATGVYLYKVRVEVERPDGETQVTERIERLAVIR